MHDPKQKRYLYLMLSGFGAISLSILLFFLLYRLQGVGKLLGELSAILAPFIYGGVMAYLLRPLCNALEAFFQMHFAKKLKRFANAAAVFSSLVIGILVVYALLTMVLPQLVNSVVTLWNSLPGKMEQLIGWAGSTFGEDEHLVSFFNENYQTYFKDIDTWVRENVIPQVSNIVSGVGTSVVRVMKFLYNILIGLIVAIYVLHGRKRFGRQAVLIVRSAFPDRWAELILEEAKFVDRMFGGFIDGKLLDSAIIGVLCYIGCILFRFPNALLVSTFVGITNVIPFFGPFIGAVPSTLLIMIENPIKGLWFIVFVLALQQLDGNVIGPKILGDRTGLSSFWVLFAIVLCGGLWGVAGMVICVPMFAVIYDIVKKLVRRGLTNKGQMQLWEQYHEDYPEETGKQ